jgi:hypothetical protein
MVVLAWFTCDRGPTNRKYPLNVRPTPAVREQLAKKDLTDGLLRREPKAGVGGGHRRIEPTRQGDYRWQNGWQR